MHSAVKKLTLLHKVVHMKVTAVTSEMISSLQKWNDDPFNTGRILSVGFVTMKTSQQLTSNESLFETMNQYP